MKQTWPPWSSIISLVRPIHHGWGMLTSTLLRFLSAGLWLGGVQEASCLSRGVLSRLQSSETPKLYNLTETHWVRNLQRWDSSTLGLSHVVHRPPPFAKRAGRTRSITRTKQGQRCWKWEVSLPLLWEAFKKAGLVVQVRLWLKGILCFNPFQSLKEFSRES